MATAGLSEAGQLPAPELLKSSANLLGLLRQTRSERLASALSDARIDAAKIERDRRPPVRLRAPVRTGPSPIGCAMQLAALGVAIKDNKDGTTTWELKR